MPSASFSYSELTSLYIHRYICIYVHLCVYICIYTDNSMSTHPHKPTYTEHTGTSSLARSCSKLASLSLCVDVSMHVFVHACAYLHTYIHHTCSPRFLPSASLSCSKLASLSLSVSLSMHASMCTYIHMYIHYI